MLEKNHVGPETNRKVGSESEEIIPDPQHCYSLYSISNWQWPTAMRKVRWNKFEAMCVR